MLKIWGRASSVNVQKVLWCADELGLVYSRVDVGGAFGGTDDPAYLAMNPNRRVPTLEDGDYAIWESNSVVRYLAATYGDDRIWPKDPRSRGRADRWMDWQLASLSPGMTTLFWGWVRTAPDKRSLDALERARGEAAGMWKILDAHLARHEYLGGQDFTMGDIPAGSMTWRWFQLPIERPDLPHLKRWHDALARRPGFQKWVMVTLE